MPGVAEVVVRRDGHRDAGAVGEVLGELAQGRPMPVEPGKPFCHASFATSR